MKICTGKRLTAYFLATKSASEDKGTSSASGPEQSAGGDCIERTGWQRGVWLLHADVSLATAGTRRKNIADRHLV